MIWNNGATICLVVSLVSFGIVRLINWRAQRRSEVENAALARTLVQYTPEIEWSRPLYRRPEVTLDMDTMTTEQFREALEAQNGER